MVKLFLVKNYKGTSIKLMIMQLFILFKQLFVTRSQTGSGKTLAYALPIIEGLQAIRPKISRNDGIRVIVVIPTRELAVQTYELFIKLVKVCKLV